MKTKMSILIVGGLMLIGCHERMQIRKYHASLDPLATSGTTLEVYNVYGAPTTVLNGADGVEIWVYRNNVRSGTIGQSIPIAGPVAGFAINSSGYYEHYDELSLVFKHSRLFSWKASFK